MNKHMVWINDDEDGKWDHIWSHEPNADCTIKYILASDLVKMLKERIENCKLIGRPALWKSEDELESLLREVEGG